MRPMEACRLHGALADALVPEWELCPGATLVLERYLAGWSTRTLPTEQAFFERLAVEFNEHGVEREMCDALGRIELVFDSRVQDIFAALKTLTRERYEKLADWAGSESLQLRVVAETNPLFPDPPRALELGAVAACVPPRLCNEATLESLDSRKGAEIAAGEVRLTFTPGQLGPPTWASVPYILCHELVCHANQGAPFSSEDGFAEGWMDFVAVKLHSVWANEVFHIKPRMACTYADRLSEVARDLQGNLTYPHVKTRSLRRTGRETASLMLEALSPGGFLHALVTDFDENPWSVFERLSLQLNRVKTSVLVRTKFVNAVAHCATREPTSTRSVLRDQLWVQFERWLRGEASAAEVLTFT